MYIKWHFVWTHDVSLMRISPEQIYMVQHMAQDKAEPPAMAVKKEKNIDR